MNKELYLVSSSPWKQQDVLQKMAHRGVVARFIATKLHCEEPNSTDWKVIGEGKPRMFWEEYVKQTEPGQLLQTGDILTVDINGTISQGANRSPSIVTTGRGKIDGITKSQQTVTTLWKRMRGRGGKRGGSIQFENICGLARVGEAKILSVESCVDSAILTLSKPLLDFLSNINNLRNIVAWEEGYGVQTITERSSGGINFAALPDSIKQIGDRMNLSGLWMTVIADGETYLVDQSGYDPAAQSLLNSVLRGITENNADRVAEWVN